MRRRRLKRLWARLQALKKQRPSYETPLLKLRAARKEAGRASSLMPADVPEPPPKGQRSRRGSFTFSLDRAKLRATCRREGRYLLRSNPGQTDPARLRRRADVPARSTGPPAP